MAAISRHNQERDYIPVNWRSIGPFTCVVCQTEREFPNRCVVRTETTYGGGLRADLAFFDTNRNLLGVIEVIDTHPPSEQAFAAQEKLPFAYYRLLAPRASAKAASSTTNVRGESSHTQVNQNGCAHRTAWPFSICLKAQILSMSGRLPDAINAMGIFTQIICLVSCSLTRIILTIRSAYIVRHQSVMEKRNGENQGNWQAVIRVNGYRARTLMRHRYCWHIVMPHSGRWSGSSAFDAWMKIAHTPKEMHK